jgi:hypothetical protein
LSSIENSKREVPVELCDKIVNTYELSPKEAVELMKAIDLSKKQHIIELEELDDERRVLTLKYARKISTLSKEDLLKLEQLFDKED